MRNTQGPRLQAVYCRDCVLAGAIPVTFEKNLVSVLPFPDLIDWSQLVIALNDTAVASGNLFGALKVLASWHWFAAWPSCI